MVEKSLTKESLKIQNQTINLQDVLIGWCYLFEPNLFYLFIF